MKPLEFKVPDQPPPETEIREGPPQPTAEEYAARQRQSLWPEALMYLRVPDRYRRVPLEVELPKGIAEWAGEPWCVTILGPTGSGKTWLAVRLFGRVFGSIQHDPNCRGNAIFADASSAVEDMRREINGENRDTLGRLSRVYGLLLDDYGAERDTEYARDRLSVLLRERYNWNRPTILTSNAESLADIARVEPRIASRLSEGIVLQLKGRDRRLK